MSCPPTSTEAFVETRRSRGTVGRFAARVVAIRTRRDRKRGVERVVTSRVRTWWPLAYQSVRDALAS